MKSLLLACALCAALPAWSAEKTATLAIPNMNCATCPITIKLALTRFPGVLGVRSDLNTKTTIVQYDERRIQLEQILRATTDAGFPSSVVGGGS